MKSPAYFASAIEDHIAPWISCYKGARNLGGPLRFVLGGSGHIAGIINPPSKNKYGHYTNQDLGLSPEDWQAGAEKTAGSWWPRWDGWLAAKSGGKVPARPAGNARHPVLCAAPGTYVVS